MCITKVFIDNPKYSHWHGCFGTAKLYDGDDYCITSTGEKIPL